MTPAERLALWQELGAWLRQDGNYPFVELRRNNLGYEVMYLQYGLMYLGYYDKALDYTFGSGTQYGMRLFERANNLKEDGVASVENQKLLFSAEAKANPGYSLTIPRATAKPGSKTPSTPKEPDPPNDFFVPPSVSIPDFRQTLLRIPDLIQPLKPLKP